MGIENVDGEPACACGARLRPGDTWCWRCHEPVKDADTSQPPALSARFGGAAIPSQFGTGTPQFRAAPTAAQFSGGTATPQFGNTARPGLGQPAYAGDSVKPLARKRSRWAGSEVTFGPVGRMVASVLVLVPLCFFIFAGSLIGIAAYGVVVVPWALRDIWRKV